MGAICWGDLGYNAGNELGKLRPAILWRRTLEKDGAKNLSILKRICLAELKFVKTYYNLRLNKIRLLLSLDFKNEIKYLS